MLDSFPLSNTIQEGQKTNGENRMCDKTTTTNVLVYHWYFLADDFPGKGSAGIILFDEALLVSDVEKQQEDKSRQLPYQLLPSQLQQENSL